MRVNLVLELGKNGEVRPLGVWAGTSWEDLSKEVKQAIKDRQYRLLLCDGERAIDSWLGKYAMQTNRGHWHLSRELGYTLWEDKASLEERNEAKGTLRNLIAVEIPGEDIEAVSESDKDELRKRIREAEKKIESLRRDFAEKGYRKAVTYLENAQGRIFNHLHLWLETGIIAPRTTFFSHLKEGGLHVFDDNRSPLRIHPGCVPFLSEFLFDSVFREHQSIHSAMSY